MRIAASRNDLEDALMQLENGDVERATAEVVLEASVRPSAVEPISKRRSGRLIHQPQHLEPGVPPDLRWPAVEHH